MERNLIIIAGYPVSGKTIFVLKLSENINLPYFNLDSIKTEIGKVIKANSWEDSVRLGNSSFFVLMYILENFMKYNKPLIIENSFIKDHEIVIENLIKKYEYKTLTYILKCDLKILHNRFIKREHSQERGSNNKVFGLWDNFQTFACDMIPFGDFTIGDNIVNINTNDFKNINYKEYVHLANDFILRSIKPNGT